ncbi:phage portal protein [Desulfocurvibacter africanus]|uniref:Phage portal protein, lambda family n=1 Tax=Desulfocurvibacter africanus subsp. africanus str. Walvis Bay TaxID=690850 RepID=F3Z2S4_DESAF|nr:phage portal protein [Desulfocurvibacter africanus]EGJ50241.1 phage portal protein, lambda family [Desulfocurvibacter africanus subsp. africanus str. Walvis Bay]
MAGRLYDFVSQAVAHVLAVGSPTRAAHYLRERQALLAYQAAQRDGPDRGWRGSKRSGDADLYRDAALVTARARDLATNNGYISGAIRKICDNCVRGGIKPQSQIKLADGKPDAILRKLLERRFARWARRKHASVDGHDSFAAMQRHVLRAVWVDGEILVHRVWVNAKGVAPFRLELIECDQLDSLVDGKLSNGNKAVRGIEFGPDGRPVAYHILEEHPGGRMAGLPGSVRVPAADIIHVYEKVRVSQTRAVSWFAAIVMETRGLSEYQVYERIAARLGSAFGLFLTTPHPELMSGPMPGLDNKTGYADVPDYLQPGQIVRLPTGTKMEVAANPRPGVTYEPYVKASLKGIAAGVGVAYQSLSQDYAETTYSGGRSAALEERLTYKGMQQFLVEKLLGRVWEWFLEAEALAGEIAMPGYWADPETYAESVQWQTPGWSWVDPAKDATADEKRLAMGVTTRRRIAANQGDDFDELVDELAEEEATLRAKGLESHLAPVGTAPAAEPVKEEDDAEA